LGEYRISTSRREDDGNETCRTFWRRGVMPPSSTREQHGSEGGLDVGDIVHRVLISATQLVVISLQGSCASVLRIL
jgi:hypothetical protein